MFKFLRKKIVLTLLLIIVAGEFFFLSKFGFSRVHLVERRDDGFYPKQLTIRQGQIVKFINHTKEPFWPASDIHPTHGIYPEFDPKKPIPPEESWSFQFNRPGQWRYHDHLHPEVTDSIIVLGNGSSYKPPPQRTYQYDPSITSDSTEIFQNDQALFSYVKKFGPQASLSRLYQLSPNFPTSVCGGGCHQQAHKVGQFAYDIDKENAFQNCDLTCQSGCYHGVIESFFQEHGTANLAQNIKLLCQDTSNPFLLHQCIHGIGHGLMAWSDYDIFRALQGCDLLDTAQDSCYTGVFMENIIGGLSPYTGHVTKFLSDDPLYPCNVVPEKYKSSCYYYQTTRMVDLFHDDFNKVAATCQQIEEKYQSFCFESMGRDVSSVSGTDPQKMITTCNLAPEENARVHCLNGAVQDGFWDPTGQEFALKFCKQLTNTAEKEACYQTIFSRASQILANGQLQSFCSKSEKKYQDTCLNFKSGAIANSCIAH